MRAKNTLTKAVILALFLLFIPAVLSISEDFSALAQGSTINSCAAAAKISDVITITNTGDITSIYIVKASGDAKNWISYAPAVLEVKPGESRSVSVYMSSPADARGEYDLTHTISTQFGLTKVISQKIKIANCQNLQVGVKGWSLKTCACNPVEYSFQMINTGTYTEIYKLGLDQYDEHSSFSENKVILEAGESKVVSAFVNLPCYMYGVFDFNVDILAQTSKYLTKIPLQLELESCFDYDIELGNISLPICELDTTTFPLIITNKADAANLYTVNTDSELANIENDTLGLWGNQKGQFDIKVVPPLDTEGKHNLTINVISQRGELNKSLFVEYDVTKCRNIDIELPQAQTICSGEAARLDADVNNEGLFREKVTLVMDAEQWAELSTTNMSVAAGKKYPFTIILSPENEVKGDYEFSVQAQTDLINTTRTFGLEVLEAKKCYQPNVEEDYFKINYTVNKLPILIENAGIKKATYRLSLDSGTWVKLDKNVIVVEKNSSQEINLVLSPTKEDVPEGKYKVTLKLDTDTSSYEIPLTVKLQEKSNALLYLIIALVVLMVAGLIAFAIFREKDAEEEIEEPKLEEIELKPAEMYDERPGMKLSSVVLIVLGIAALLIAGFFLWPYLITYWFIALAVVIVGAGAAAIVYYIKNRPEQEELETERTYEDIQTDYEEEYKDEESENKNRKYWIIGIIALIIAFALYYFTMPLIGGGNETAVNITENITETITEAVNTTAADETAEPSAFVEGMFLYKWYIIAAIIVLAIAIAFNEYNKKIRSLMDKGLAYKNRYKTIEFDDEDDTGIMWLKFKPRLTLTDFAIKTKLLDKNPVDSKLKAVYKYLEIKRKNIYEKDIKKAKIYFKVKKSWLERKGEEGRDIVLKRYYDDQWNDLSTRLIAEDQFYYYYMAKSKTFSYFAIAVKDLEAAKPVKKADKIEKTVGLPPKPKKEVKEKKKAEKKTKQEESLVSKKDYLIFGLTFIILIAALVYNFSSNDTITPASNISVEDNISVENNINEQAEQAGETQEQSKTALYLNAYLYYIIAGILALLLLILVPKYMENRKKDKPKEDKKEEIKEDIKPKKKVEEKKKAEKSKEQKKSWLKKIIFFLTEEIDQDIEKEDLDKAPEKPFDSKYLWYLLGAAAVIILVYLGYVFVETLLKYIYYIITGIVLLVLILFAQYMHRKMKDKPESYYKKVVAKESWLKTFFEKSDKSYYPYLVLVFVLLAAILTLLFPVFVVQNINYILFAVALLFLVLVYFAIRKE